MNKQKRYRLKNLAKIKAQQKAWRDKNKHKRQAHALVKRAIEKGVLMRPDECERCGTVALIQAHHSDYTKPLDVDWLCSKCHSAEHGMPVGRPVHGEAHGRAKLTEKQVREIKTLLAQKKPGRVIGRQYDVDEGLIRQIKRGLIWKSV